MHPESMGVDAESEYKAEEGGGEGSSSAGSAVPLSAMVATPSATDAAGEW